MPADLPHPSESALIRREGEQLERIWTDDDPPSAPRDGAMFDHSAAVWRVLDGSGSTRPGS